jgi:fatty acid desaturase 2 (delta-6 desaturase)
MGKGGDKATAPADEKAEVLIDGRFYDVTSLKHPGGSVIQFYAGKEIDATQAFNNFHVRSKKARKMLESLSSRPADEKKVAKDALPGQRELLADFDEFTRQLEKEGYFKPAPAHVAFRVTEIICLYAGGFWCLLNNYIVVGLLMLSIAQGRCGWLMHEGGHYSLTGTAMSTIRYTCSYFDG